MEELKNTNLEKLKEKEIELNKKLKSILIDLEKSIEELQNIYEDFKDKKNHCVP